MHVLQTYACDRFTAEGPLGPSSMSNDMVAPSVSVSMPAACTADMCTNTSLSSVAMNPKPFCPLNHYTVPVLLMCVVLFLLLLLC